LLVQSRSQQKKFSFPFRRKNQARAKEKQRKLFLLAGERQRAAAG
jgi:hypothetical protein